MLRNRLLLLLFVLGLTFALTGCLKGEQTSGQLDVPEDVTMEDEDDGGETTEGAEQEEAVQDELNVTETEQTVERELYLFDQSGLVVPQTVELPKSASAAMQALEYLVVDGPVTELLPNGFQAVIPAGTEIIGVNLKEDGTLIVDVSEDFKNYEAENELKVLQAVTHTLTQFDTIEKIKLWINGEEQTEMPVSGTPISQGFSRANGINLDVIGKPDLNSQAVTVFYPKKYDEDIAFIPVTTYLERDENNYLFAPLVESLLHGPSQSLGTLNVFNDNTQLIKEPTIRDGVLQLEFSEDILQSKDEAVIADEVIATLVRNLTEQVGIEAVSVSVANFPTIVSENGTPYDQPVTAQDVMGKEKM